MGKGNGHADEYERTLKLILTYAKTRPLLVLLVLRHGIDNVDVMGDAIHVRFFSTDRPDRSEEGLRRPV
jgi:hypothetical protein